VLDPSTGHGVTTIVTGNCGVGFAPVRPGSQQWLIQLMEGVEDIPGTALAEGIDWAWETFPEYLDSLDRTPKAVNILPYVPLGPMLVETIGLDDAKSGRLPSDEEHAKQGRVCAAVVSADRKPRRRVADLMIAAVAIAQDLSLYTTSPDDFAGLDGLLAIAPVTRPSTGPPPGS
jgi:hypothetical protein